MIKKTYSEKLKDPRWQKKRLFVLERDHWTCQSCQATKKTLNVHHQKYSRAPWSVKKEFLITYCEDCHELLEYLIKNISFFSSKKIKVVRHGKAQLITVYGVFNTGEIGLNIINWKDGEKMNIVTAIREDKISKIIEEFDCVKNLINS